MLYENAENSHAALTSTGELASRAFARHRGLKFGSWHRSASRINTLYRLAERAPSLRPCVYIFFVLSRFIYYLHALFIATLTATRQNSNVFILRT